MPNKQVEALLARIRAAAANLGDVRLMEVCGTHTMAIARAGLKRLLPKNVLLLSGPGCPVCVTPASELDACFALAQRPDILLATYGDMLRVPGSARGDSLARRRAEGADVRIVYSPMDALELAAHTDKRVVFLGVGFETGAPGTAAALCAAEERGVENFYVYPLLKRLRPALTALASASDFRVNGLICPGHVASILGERGFAYVPEALGLPGVIAGFETEDILLAVALLLEQLAAGEVRLQNAYPRAVRPEGNRLAQACTDEVFKPCAAVWRGLGSIEGGGYALREGFGHRDAGRALNVRVLPEQPSACCCGAVLRGVLPPEACPLFGVCTPEDPIGPCMVSAEGSCAAAYAYRQL